MVFVNAKVAHAKLARGNAPIPRAEYLSMLKQFSQQWHTAPEQARADARAKASMMQGAVNDPLQPPASAAL
eukprot:2396128-Alexandrium_andersonii.AAC.1